MKYFVRFFLFFVAHPFRPCPQAVGDGQQCQRQQECEQHLDEFAGHSVVGLLSDGQLVGACRELVGVGQLVVAPLAYDGCVLKEQQSGVASYYGLECCLVGCAERVFGSGQVAPAVDVAVGRSRDAVEWYVMLRCVLVYLVDVAEVAVVGVCQRA